MLRLLPRALLASLAALILTQVFVIAPRLDALTVVATILWMAWPGVLFARGVLRASEPSGIAAWMIGPAFGLAFSVFGVMLWWLVGLTNGLSLVLGPGLTWLIVLLVTRFGGPTLNLPTFGRRDIIAAALLLSVVPAVTWAPYDHVGERVTEGEAYRAYFTADFMWAMTVTGALAKGHLPPANPFLVDQHLHYYWMAHFLSGALHRTLGPTGMSKEGIILIDGVAFGLAFVAFLYVLVRSVGAGPAVAAVFVAAGFLANSYEGADMIRALLRQGQSFNELRLVNIDAITRWFYHGMAVDGLQRLLLYQPHHLTGYMAALASLWLVGCARDVNETSVPLWAGILLAVTLVFSTFSALIVGVAVSLLFAWRIVQQQQWRAILPSIVLGAVPAGVGVALTDVMGYTDHRYGMLLEVGLNAIAVRGGWWVLFLSLGPLLIAGLIGLCRLRWTLGQGAAPAALVVSSLLFYFLVNVPDTGGIWVGWRSGHMLQIAFAAIGAALVTAWWATRWARPVIAATTALAFLLAVPTTAIDVFNAQDIGNREQGPDFPWTLIITREEREALDWIKQETPPDAVVQTESYVRGSRHWALVPALAERRSISLGMVSMVPQRPYREAADQVMKDVYMAHTAEEAHAFARSLGIDYVVAGRIERRAYATGTALMASRPELFPQVFRNDEMTIFRVK